eukprot:5376428-Pyramimonas_sp.AAC.1
MPAQQRARHVRGPQSAIVIYLLENGWDPVQPNEWRLPGALADGTDTWEFKTEALSGIPAVDIPEALLTDLDNSVQD